MILISWNIDSLNAALTGTSARAEETRQVLTKIHDANPDIIAIQETKLRATGPTKKHKEVLAEKFPEYDYVWRSSEEPARKGYAGTMYLYKKGFRTQVTCNDNSNRSSHTNEILIYSARRRILNKFHPSN